jgi:hypothetical protein
MHCANFTACVRADPEPLDVEELLGLGEEPHAASGMEQTASDARRRPGTITRLTVRGRK